MLECWQEHPNDRPTFSQLRTKFSTLLLANVDDPYMVLEVDDAKAYYNVEEEETSEQRESVSSDDSDSSIKKKKKGPPKKPVWAKPSNPYVDTPALATSVAITLEEETPQEAAAPADNGGGGQGGGLALPESAMDGFDPYIKMQSSPIDVEQQAQDQQMSVSLPAEGLSISVLSEEKVAHQRSQSAKRTRSNPYVDDPGRRQLLDDEAGDGVGNKLQHLSSIAENGTATEGLVSEP